MPIKWGNSKKEKGKGEKKGKKGWSKIWHNGKPLYNLAGAL